MNDLENNDTNSSNKPFLITTVDNPYNPFTNFQEWFLFDSEKGYGTCDLIGRLVNTSYQLSDEENQEEIQNAYEQILKYDEVGLYKKIYEDDKVVVTNISI